MGIHWSDGDVWQKMALLGDVEGEWRMGTITGSRLVWARQEERNLFGEGTTVSRQGNEIFMEVGGGQCRGNAGLAEGEIHWSDGDVWQKMALLVDIQGDWKLVVDGGRKVEGYRMGTITDSRLVWARQEERSLFGEGTTVSR